MGRKYGEPWGIPDEEPGDWFRGVDGADHETIRDYIGSLLGFCGCGMPDESLDWLRDTLAAVRERQELWRMNGGQGFRFESMEGLPEPVRYILWYWMDHYELIEHGGSVTGSWLTDRGTEVLERLTKHEGEKN